MRRVISVGLAAVLLLALGPAGMGMFRGLLHSTTEASSSDLTCSVKASCSGSEVAVFRMESTSNAHAGTVDGSTYDNVVCCSGPAGLSASCTGSYATILRLSGTDNAHVASSDLSYGTQACLSVTGTTIKCEYASSSCGSSNACLATISGSTNAHVADCDGTNDYATRVCCYAGAALAVGGIAEPPDAADSAGGSSSLLYTVLAGAAAAVVVLAAGGWYARRRRRTRRET